jgi:hypothetical protein
MPPDRFASHLPALAASATATVIAATAGSYLPFGAGGTAAGLVAGSLISGTVAWHAERIIRRSADVARMKAAAVRRKGAPLSVTETQRIEAIVTRRHHRRMPWRRAALICVCTLAAAMAVVTGWEMAAGLRPLAAIVRHESGHGLSVAGGRVQAPSRAPASAPPPPTVSPAATTAAPVVSPDISPVAPGSVTPTDTTSPAPADTGTPATFSPWPATPGPTPAP